MIEQNRNLLLRIVIALASNNMERVNVHLQKAHECAIPHEQIYEAILQIHLFAGYPASIEGLNGPQIVSGIGSRNDITYLQSMNTSHQYVAPYEP